MSDQDKSLKTEEPTARRIEKAREEGNVPKSRELNNFLVLFTAGLMMVLLFPYLGKLITNELGQIVLSLHDYTISAVDLTINFKLLAIKILLIVLIPCFFLTIIGVFSLIFVQGFNFSPQAMKFKIERLDPIKGFERVFSMQSLFEFLKGILKVSIVGAIGFVMLIPSLINVDEMIRSTPNDVFQTFSSISFKIIMAMLAVYFIIMVADIMYQKYSYRQKLRMTRQEVKDEYKQTEGDPLIKSRIRQIRTERHRRRLIDTMSKADVVVTNPTHYSVALEYKIETMNAPVVVAKGKDHQALLIKKIAKDKDIPIVENAPLAQALYASCAESDEINPEHYQAAATVISFIIKRQKHSLNKPQKN